MHISATGVKSPSKLTRLEKELVSLRPFLRRFARGLLRNQSDVEDLVQETLVKVLAAQDRFRLDGNLKSWSCQILYRTFVDHHRILRRNGIESDSALLVIPVEPSQEWAIKTKELWRALEILPHKTREILLVVASGATHEEAAQTLKCNVSTVKNRVSRERKLLQAHMNPVEVAT